MVLKTYHVASSRWPKESQDVTLHLGVMTTAGALEVASQEDEWRNYLPTEFWENSEKKGNGGGEAWKTPT